jgi:hypothetical protein
LIIVASLIAGYYFLSGGYSASQKQKALSGEPANSSTETPLTGKDSQVIAKFDSASGEELKVTLEDGSEATYYSTQIFFLCKTANSEVYESVKENNATSIDPSYLIPSQDLETKLNKEQEIEIFLYLFDSGEGTVKGVVSPGC